MRPDPEDAMPVLPLPETDAFLVATSAAAALGLLVLAGLLRRLVGLMGERAALAGTPGPARRIDGLDASAPRAGRPAEAARVRAEADSEAKSRLLATVSHEFRTPLNGILGMSALLLETPLDAEQQTYVRAIRSSAEAFTRLVDDILDFSRIEAGRIELTDESFDLPALVQGVVELLAPRAQSKGTEIACYIAPDVPRQVRGDPDRLRQVLFNLAGNAVKFTAIGGVGVSVERGPDEAILIRIEDTGPGIPAARIGSIFEEFEQAGGAPSGEPGTGLGLAITRRLVARMGGRISVESEPGRGSCFALRLGLPRTEPTLTAASYRIQPIQRVLVICGSAFEGRYLERVLADAGHDATLAATLAEGLGLMEQNRFDVCIADHALAEDDARGIAREARRRGVAHTVVLLSPFERRDVGSPHASGFDAYLIKPVRARSLMERLTAAPRGAPSRAVVHVARPAAVAPARSGPARRVLLAEDNEVNALLATKALERLGARIEWVRDGLAAVARAEAALRGEAEGLDLILMDVRMPGLDGVSATGRIRALENELGRPRIRIVALTASLVGDGAVPLGEAGFDALLAKPVDLADLEAALGEQEPRYRLAS